MKFKSHSPFLFASPQTSRFIRRVGFATLLSFAVATIGCDSIGTEAGDPPRDAAVSEAAGSDEFALSQTNPRSAAGKGDAQARLGRIQSRADAAFDDIMKSNSGSARSRGESRIGLQPWPADLSASWPRPEQARVLADTQRDGDRLLLVDLPGDVDRAALDFGRALQANGYEVDRANTRQIEHALHAETGGQEIVLTFFAREDQTRVEILFLGGSAS